MCGIAKRKIPVTAQVGQPGLGKELFIKNAFAAYCEDNDLPVNSCPPETTADAFTRSPSEYCTDIVLEVDSSQSKIHYVIQVCQLCSLAVQYILCGIACKILCLC